MVSIVRTYHDFGDSAYCYRFDFSIVLPSQFGLHLALELIIIHFMLYPVLESVNRQPPHTECWMNEIHWVLLGLIVMVLSVTFFYFTDILPAKIESREVSIVISLGIGLLILVVDKRQDRHLNEIIEAQHKMTNEIHKMIKEEIRLIKEMQRENNDRS